MSFGIPVRNGLGIGLLASTTLSTFNSGFTPASLFVLGEEGAWYDPSDLSTMFTTSAGTTPVTAAGDPVGLILDKSKRGVGTNGSYARNLVLQSQNASVSPWSFDTSTGSGIALTGGLAPDGVTQFAVFNEGTSTGAHRANQGISVVVGTTYTVSAYIKAGTSRYILLGTTRGGIAIDTQDWAITQTIALASTTTTNGTLTPIGDGVYRASVSVAHTTDTSSYFIISTSVSATPGTMTPAFTGTSRTAVFTFSQFEVGSTATAYQPITSSWAATMPGNHATQATTTARPILRQDADGKYYLQNDEVDDALTVTFPNLGSDCTVGYVTASEVFLYEGQTISGAYTLPATDLYNIVIIDRALTLSEKINLIRYLASKVDGVNYGGEIDRLTLIAINAVDVFVYDTSKDSDGGAWRNNTSSTSWYNETLNTATRGSRRQFPAVAVIVAEFNKVTIYDGDDPSLPMWIVINGSALGRFLYDAYTADATCITAFNGQLIVGVRTVGDTSGNFGGGVVFDFCSDKSLKLAAVSSNSNYGEKAGVRAVEWGPPAAYRIPPLYRLINGMVNDVAMTVLPGAPTDPATGLPVPTIAVATNGGVSVITDSGAVYDITGGIPNNISFTAENKLFFDFDVVAGGSRAFRVVPIPEADTNIALTSKPAGTEYYTTAIFAASYPEDVAFLNGYAAKAVPNAIGFRTGTSHLALIAPKPDDNTKAMIAFTTSTFNTGWMNGDIKGAFLSDTDDTDLVGSGELVTNGTFDTDISGWTAGNGAILARDPSGALTITNGAASNGYAFQTIPTVIGQTYVMSVFLTPGTSLNPRLAAGTGVFSGNLLTLQAVGANQYTGTFVAAGTTTWITSVVNNATLDANATFDNISVQLADADRSVNNKGLIVNGTVTRTAVASGADLVAYSGFSAANYLEQPYNSALNFGTGDFCVMGWYYGGAVNGYFLDNRDTGSGGFAVGINNASRLQFVLTNSAGSLADVSGADTVVSPTALTFFTALRRSGVCELYANGSLLRTQASTIDVNGTSPLIVGAFSAGGIVATPWAGSLALLRISATAPTADQILKIYNDELPLFQVNARATLYGASDAVAALAHDPDTGLLHVGTSAGRSVFRGLERLSNTTTSVAATISASGGLVVSK